MLLVVALGWLVGLVSVKGKVAAMLTVERVDSSSENSNGERFHSVFCFLIIITNRKFLLLRSSRPNRMT